MKMELDYKKYAELARRMGAEGCVLLENRDQALPVRAGECVSVFGRIQCETYYCGTGSGGLVNPPYVVTILEGIEAQCRINEELKKIYKNWLAAHPFDVGKGWAQEPWSQEEMPVSRELAQKAASQSDIAVVVIGRTAGEDQDNKAEQGAFYLSEKEEMMLQNVCEAFKRVAVVLNVGSIIDMSWVERYQPAAVLYSWQGGCEGGNALADVLTGKVNPSGKLPDTIARTREDYPSAGNFGDPGENCYAEDIYVGYRYFETFAPDKVLYPFGYGLSYTSFSCRPVSCEVEENQLKLSVNVENTGDTSGKQTVQFYCCPPQGKLGKAARNLIGFAKTQELAPGESEVLNFEVDLSALSSYDDSGKTGFTYSWVLEEGEYGFYAGFDVRSAEKIGSWIQHQTIAVEKLQQALAPVKAFHRLTPGKMLPDGRYQAAYEPVPLRSYSLDERMKENLQKCVYKKHDEKYLWQDVCEGRVSLDTFLEQFTDEELACMTRGEGMCSPRVTPGTASAFGGITDHFQSYGIPACCCADGPSGIRMDCGAMAFSLPNGTAIASSFNTALVEELYSYLARELVKNRVDTLLGPGLNIHRDPLCGRNFEYFSEDPLLTGCMAVAQLSGMHPWNVTGTIKHFACNNQEYRRHTTNAVVSERALREIYMKAFEIAVRKGNARSIMTSYNPINGIWSASNYDLLTTILRKEWGYTGLVMTDWWADMNNDNDAPSKQNTAAMIRAQNDIYMVVSDAASNSAGDNTMAAVEAGTLSRNEIVRCVRNICNVMLKTNASAGHRATENLSVLNQPEFRSAIQIGQTYELNEERINLDLPSTINRGTRIVYTIHKKEAGSIGFGYRIHTVQESEVAQVPVSIFANHELVKTVSLKGNSSFGEVITLGAEENLTIELFFGDNGMFVDELYVARG